MSPPCLPGQSEQKSSVDTDLQAPPWPGATWPVHPFSNHSLPWLLLSSYPGSAPPQTHAGPGPTSRSARASPQIPTGLASWLPSRSLSKYHLPGGEAPITGRPHCIMLCFIALHRYCIFHKLKVGGNAASTKSVGTILPTAFAHFMSPCHIWVILAVFQTLSLLYLWWLTCDPWSSRLPLQEECNLPKAQMMVSTF